MVLSGAPIAKHFGIKTRKRPDGHVMLSKGIVVKIVAWRCLKEVGGRLALKLKQSTENIDKVLWVPFLVLS